MTRMVSAATVGIGPAARDGRRRPSVRSLAATENFGACQGARELGHVPPTPQTAVQVRDQPVLRPVPPGGVMNIVVAPVPVPCGDDGLTLHVSLTARRAGSPMRAPTLDRYVARHFAFE